MKNEFHTLLKRLIFAGLSVMVILTMLNSCGTPDDDTFVKIINKETDLTSEYSDDDYESLPVKASRGMPDSEISYDVPEAYDYVLNTNSMKFHYSSCSSVDDMSEKNKSYFSGTRDELISMGYSPCGRCLG